MALRHLDDNFRPGRAPSAQEVPLLSPGNTIATTVTTAMAFRLRSFITRDKPAPRPRIGDSDYARLRSWKSWKKEAVDSSTLRVVDKAGLDSSDAAKALRWALRGLPADMAVHKVKVDLEIGQNAREARRY